MHPLPSSSSSWWFCPTDTLHWQWPQRAFDTVPDGTLRIPYYQVARSISSHWEEYLKYRHCRYKWPYHTRCAPRHKYSYDHKKKTQEMEGGRYKKLTFMLYHASNHCSTIRCPLLLILLPLRTHIPVHLFKLPNTFAMAYKLNHSNLCHNDDATVISFDKWFLHPLFVSTDAFLWPLLQRSGWRMS